MREKSQEPTPPADITRITLRGTEGIAISSDSRAITLSSGLPKIFRPPSTSKFFPKAVHWVTNNKSATLRQSVVNWRFLTQNTKNKEHLDSGYMEYRPHTDEKYNVMILENENMFFTMEPRQKRIRIWSLSDGMSKGTITYSKSLEPTPFSMVVDGWIVWFCFPGSFSIEGWDLKKLAPVPFDPSNIPENLRLACFHAHGIEGIGTDVTIVDVVSKTEVYRLDGRYTNPSLLNWDGRHLVAYYKQPREEFLLVDLYHSIPR